MEKNRSKILDDISRMFGGIASAALPMRDEIAERIATYVETRLDKKQFATREELNIVRDMASHARRENEALRKELNALKASRPPKQSARSKSK